MPIQPTKREETGVSTTEKWTKQLKKSCKTYIGSLKLLRIISNTNKIVSFNSNNLMVQDRFPEERVSE